MEDKLDNEEQEKLKLHKYILAVDATEWKAMTVSQRADILHENFGLPALVARSIPCTNDKWKVFGIDIYLYDDEVW